jgi:hypothetical protein
VNGLHGGGGKNGEARAPLGIPGFKGWQRPTLPRPLERSTIGATGLNCRVRNGNGCGPCALVASQKLGRESWVVSRENFTARSPWRTTIEGSDGVLCDVRKLEEIKLHGRLVALD